MGSAAAQRVDRAPRKAPKAKAPKPNPVIIQVEPAVSQPRLHESFGRIGGNLTPNDVTSILIEADTGIPARLVDLTHESRQKDGHLQSVLATFELAIQALPWDCVAPVTSNRRDAKPRLKDKKVADFCKRALTNCATFPTLIAHQTGESHLFSYAYSETMWKVEQGYMVPEAFLPISCRRFAFTQSEGRLVFVENPHTQSGVDLLESYPAGKFVVSRRRVNGDVPVREGLCRCLVWAA